MGTEVLMQENVSGNLISINDQGGVVTKFGNVKETYQLEDQEAKDLAQLLHKHDPRELLEIIPAPKLVDLSVGMTRGDISLRQFLDVKEEFELDPKYMREYRLMYEIGIKKSDGQFSEPSTDIDAFKAELEEMKAKMDSKGYTGVSEGEAQIGDAVTPQEVQQVEFTKIR